MSLVCEFCKVSVDEGDVRWLMFHKDVVLTPLNYFDNAKCTMYEKLVCPGCCDRLIDLVSGFDYSGGVKDAVVRDELGRLESRIDSIEDDLSKVRDDVRDEIDLFRKFEDHVEFRNGTLVLKNVRVDY